MLERQGEREEDGGRRGEKESRIGRGGEGEREGDEGRETGSCNVINDFGTWKNSGIRLDLGAVKFSQDRAKEMKAKNKREPGKVRERKGKKYLKKFYIPKLRLLREEKLFWLEYVTLYNTRIAGLLTLLCNANANSRGSSAVLTLSIGACNFFYNAGWNRERPDFMGMGKLKNLNVTLLQEGGGLKPFLRNRERF